MMILSHPRFCLDCLLNVITIHFEVLCLLVVSRTLVFDGIAAVIAVYRVPFQIVLYASHQCADALSFYTGT